MKANLLFAGTLVALSALATAAHAAGTQALAVNSSDVRYDYSGTIGYTFTVNSPIEVSELGYDVTSTSGTNSLMDSHTIEIWSDAPTTPALEAEATVLPGSYTSGFTYVPVAGGTVTLTDGTYTIGANTGANTGSSSYGGVTADGFLDDATVTSNLSAVTYDYGVYSAGGNNGGTVSFPDQQEPAGTSSDLVHHPSGYFGPNFQATPAPEPSQISLLALMGIGLSGLILRARKAASARNLAP